MISFSTVNYSVGRNIVFDDTFLSETEELSARVSRVKTLDGGCEILHSGVSESDRTMRLSVFLLSQKAEILKTLFWNETLVTVANNDGVYYGTIEKYRNDNGKITMSVLIKELI